MAFFVNSNTVIDDSRVFFPVNSAEKVANISISTSTISIDLNSATVFNLTLSANVSTVNVSNTQALGLTSSFVLVTTGDGSTSEITWPAAFKWPDNAPPAITTTNNKKDVFSFFTIDGGTSWQAFIVGQNI